MKNKFSLLKKAVVGIISATTLIFTSQVGAAVITYNNQTAFLNDNTGLTLENFDENFGFVSEASFDSGFTASRPESDTAGVFSIPANTPAGSNFAVSGDALANHGNLFESELSFTFKKAINSYGVTISNVGNSGDSYDLVVGNNAGFSQTVASFPSTLLPGDQLFFGITSDVAFTTITWSSSSDNDDLMGFDNMYFGTTAIVPEPGTYATFGLAVVMLGFLGCRSRKRKS